MQCIEEVEKNVAVATGTYRLTSDEEKLIEKDLGIGRAVLPRL
jgi:hypothetical protein